MSEWEWFRLLVGIVIPLLIAHGIWATVTIMRLRHIIEGPEGKNGLRNDVRKIEDWRDGKPPYGPKNLESRCNHEARNIVQGMTGELDIRISKLEAKRR